MKFNLDQERMAGYGPYIIDGLSVNYLYGLNDLCQKYLDADSVVLELGSNDGISTELFSIYSERVVAVDINKSIKLESLLNKRDNIEFHHTSFESYLYHSLDFFDLVYIDGDHSYEAVRRDVANFRCKVKPGGCLAGHDFNSDTPGVRKALLEVFDEASIEVFSDSSWLVKLG